MSYYARPIIYLMVVLVAGTLSQKPWMIAMQAAAGGFALGTWVERWLSEAPAAKEPEQL